MPSKNHVNIPFVCNAQITIVCKRSISVLIKNEINNIILLTPWLFVFIVFKSQVKELKWVVNS